MCEYRVRKPERTSNWFEKRAEKYIELDEDQQLSLHTSKSEYVVIGHRRQLYRVGNDLPDLVLNNEVIKRAGKTKYLGINIDESLSWKEQYKTIKNKLKGDLSSLRKLKNILPQRKLYQVYKALFENHLRYGNIVWSALSNIKLSQLQQLQTKAKKLIAIAKYKDGWTCTWLTVKSLISFDQGVMTYRILHDLCPENLRQIHDIRVYDQKPWRSANSQS